jgi:chromosome segregation ATPase
MTVAGKGGRPRKWRSDADRVRAYRARQQGVEEPPVLAVALDDGDDLARAWDTIRQLGEQLGEAGKTRQQLQKELRAATRDLNQQQQRFGWIEKDCFMLRIERDALIIERDELRGELGTLRPRIGAVEPHPAAVSSAPSATPPPLSRAGRRRLEREQQRRDRNR